MSRIAQRIAFQHPLFTRSSIPYTSLRLPCTRHISKGFWRGRKRPTSGDLNLKNVKDFVREKGGIWAITRDGIGWITWGAVVVFISFSDMEWLLYPFRLIGGTDREIQLDSAGGSALVSAKAKGAKIEIITPERKTGRDGELVPTGTSTVPFFPRKIWLPRSGAVDDGKSAALPAGTGIPDDDEEYQLLGLGIRTVSFLSIQVYVVGLYVSHSDLSTLQEKIVHAVAAPGASTLVQGEKVDLKRKLLDEQGSEAIWSSVLKEAGLKSAIRIVPTRSTNFNHLRDGWVRMITARRTGAEFADPGFEVSLGLFKTIFGARQLKKGKALLLGRGADGSLGAWLEEDDETSVDSTGSGSVVAGIPNRVDGEKKEKEKKSLSRMVWMGGLTDERISRLVWMGYLAGANVASEAARNSVVDGVIELVERPIGTVDTQVV